MRKYIEDITGMLVLLALAAVLLLPSLRGHELPLDLSHANSLAPWLQADSPVSASALSQRHVEETYPAYKQIERVGLEGGGLLWNSTDGLGAPFLAQWHTRALSPFSLPVYTLGLNPGLAVGILLKLLVAALTAYYTARRFGLRAPVALSVAALFMLSPPLLTWGAEPLADALPWAPLLLLAGERLALRQRHAWPTLALATAMISLSGHPPALSGALLFLLVYVPLRARGQAPGQRLLHLIPALMAMIMGAALAGVQLWPYLEYLGQTQSGEAGFQPVTGLHWSSVFLPVQSGDFAALNFAGFLPLLLLPLWWIMRGFMDSAQRTRTDILLVMGFAGLLLAAFNGDHVLAPWLDSSVFLFGSALALAFVVGAIAEEWLVLTAEQVRDSLPLLTKLVPAAWVVWLIGVITLGYTGVAWYGVGIALLITLLTCALLAFTLFRPTPRGLGYGLILIATLSATLLTQPLKPHTKAGEEFQLSAFGKDLSSGGLHRIAGSGALKSWPLSLLGMQQCFGPNTSGIARMAAFESAATELPLLLRRTGSTGLLLTKEDIRGAMSDIRPVLQTKAVFEQGAILFEDESMTARARVIYAGKRADHPGQLPETPDALPILEGSSLPEDGNTTPGAATVESESPSELRIVVPNTPPGILVLADLWYPGWTATVNAVDTPVFPVDGIFRGVEIGEGAHEAVFRFQPASFRYGLIVSAAAALFLLIGFWRNTAAND